MNSTKHYTLQGYVGDRSEDLSVELFVDADFCGDRLDTKSTSGAMLVLTGPNTFFPLTWMSQKQTATSRSTTESEVIALAHAMFREALPSLSFWGLALTLALQN